MDVQTAREMMVVSSFVCVGALPLLVYLLRRGRLSLGLPLAYLGQLLLIHVPGAVAHAVGGVRLYGDEFVAIGIGITAVGVVCFMVGVWAARASTRAPHEFVRADRGRFALFCLVGGWLFVFVLGRFAQTPSLGAAVNEGGGIWVLGVLLGLRGAVSAGDWLRTAAWLAALAVFPVWILVLAGFTSYGSEAAIVALSVLAISARRYWRALASIVLIIVMGLTFFVNYFEHRKAIRHEAWGGASMENRVDAVLGILDGFHPIDFGSEQDMLALDKRLNQNLFVGLAAARLSEGEVGFLNGRSVWDGVLELIPRAYWPDKPVVAGSGHLVIDMTGLHLDENTSWGVGNVMEFYINFGMPGVIAGFLLLGWALGALDIHAAAAERRGDFRRAIVLFLPAVGLIQPNGSVVEMTGAAAAAFVAAVGWQWLWDVWRVRGRAGPGPARVGVRRSPGPPPELLR